MSRRRSEAAVGLCRRLHLCGWIVGAAVIELALYASYRGEDGRFHWFTHFFVGTAFALVVMTLVTKRTGRPVRLLLLWLLVGHLVAMAPDFAFVEGVPHGRWMDVFLAHVSSHYIFGRNWTWYGVFLTALAAYLVVIDSLRPPPQREHPTLTGSPNLREPDHQAVCPPVRPVSGPATPQQPARGTT